MLRSCFAVSALVAGLVLACSDDDPDPSGTAGNGGSAGSGGGAGTAGTGGTGGMGMTGGVSFAEDIHPILLAKCGGATCHGGANNSPFQPTHAVVDVEEAYDATQGMSLDGDPIYERILSRTSGDDPLGMMPPNFANPPCEGELDAPGCLTTAEWELIEQWVNAGAPP